MKDFCVIDSNNLENIQTNFFGYSYNKDNIITSIEDLSNFSPNLNGAYIYINNKNSKITIKQDFIGCWGLYIFKEDDYFALSNSFLYLVEYLSQKHKVTLNKNFINGILFTTQSSYSYDETMVNEIKLIDRNAEIEIDTNKKELNIKYNNHKEHYIEINSKEGIEILDSWYFKWCSIIRKLYIENKIIITDLTGGMDSRTMFVLFLGANIDLNDIWVNSGERSKEDYSIALKISNFYNFSLNNKQELQKTYKNTQEIINSSAYLKFGFHNIIHFKPANFFEPVFHFRGDGGECLRKYWKYANKQDVLLSITNNMKETMREKETNSIFKKIKNYFINKQLEKIEYCKIESSIANILNSTIEKIENKYRKLNDTENFDLAYALYNETRCRVHFGKAQAERFLANDISQAPLCDIELRKLKLNDKNCEDKNLLPALILSRYAPELLNFEFDKNRIIEKETIEYAKKINSNYPLKIKFESLKRNPKTHKTINISSKKQTKNNIKQLFDKAMSKKVVKKYFLSLYSKALYERLLEKDDIFISHNLRLIYNVITLCSIMKNLNSVEKKENIYNFVTNSE